MEDLGIPIATKTSPVRTNEGSNDMNTHDNLLQTPHINTQLLNTPLANAMKKVGMTPILDNRLNNFVKKKVVPIQMGQTSMDNSNSTSPKGPQSTYGDGTGGLNSHMMADQSSPTHHPSHVLVEQLGQ